VKRQPACAHVERRNEDNERAAAALPPRSCRAADNAPLASPAASPPRAKVQRDINEARTCSNAAPCNVTPDRDRPNRAGETSPSLPPSLPPFLPLAATRRAGKALLRNAEEDDGDRDRALLFFSFLFFFSPLLANAIDGKIVYGSPGLVSSSLQHLRCV